MEWIIIDDGTDKIEDLIKGIDIIKYYKLYEDMMHYWKGLYQKEIFELDYELLINNPKQEVKKKFCA